MSAGREHIGRTIAGRFRITGFIGEGAMAAVYRGTQDAEPRDVAVKIMHPQLLGDQTFVGRFRREAKAASRLKHPNTVHIVDAGVEGNLPYIVMELITGQDLFDVLAVERRLSEARAVRMMIGICEALSAAHEHGIVHRDLKPENVMVLSDPANPAIERVKVLDFGIAKMVEGGGRPGEDGPNSLWGSGPNSISNGALTTVGVVVGTPAYMSPEQCKGDPVDGRSDIYACGVLLFLLVTGHLPFPPTSIPWEVALDHLRKEPPAPNQYLPAIHPGLEAAILTALSKWPTQRQQSARELRDELEKLLPELAESVHPTVVPGDLKDAPTIEVVPPVSIRSRVTAAPPLRDVELPPPTQRPSSRGVDRLIPPGGRSDTETRTLPVGVLAPLPAPDKVILAPDRQPGAAGGARAPESAEAEKGRASEGAARVDEVAGAGDAPGRDSLTSEAPPSSELVIQDRAEIDALLGARVTEASRLTKPSAASASAGVARAVGAATGRSEGLRRLPPRRPGELAKRLVVPVAVILGVGLGVLAFFLTR